MGETWYLALSAALPALGRVFPLSTHRPADAIILFSLPYELYIPLTVSPRPLLCIHLCLGILGVPTPWCSHVRLLQEWFSSDTSPVGVVLLGVLALGCFALKALPYCSQEWLLAVCVATQSVEGFPFLPALFTIDCARVSDAWCQPIPASDRFYLHFSPHFP